jgi:hypothetical protein
MPQPPASLTVKVPSLVCQWLSASGLTMSVQEEEHIMEIPTVVVAVAVCVAMLAAAVAYAAVQVMRSYRLYRTMSLTSAMHRDLSKNKKAAVAACLKEALLQDPSLAAQIDPDKKAALAGSALAGSALAAPQSPALSSGLDAALPKPHRTGSTGSSGTSSGSSGDFGTASSEPDSPLSVKLAAAKPPVPVPSAPAAAIVVPSPLSLVDYAKPVRTRLASSHKSYSFSARHTPASLLHPAQSVPLPDTTPRPEHDVLGIQDCSMRWAPQQQCPVPQQHASLQPSPAAAGNAVASASASPVSPSEQHQHQAAWDSVARNDAAMTRDQQ